MIANKERRTQLEQQQNRQPVNLVLCSHNFQESTPRRNSALSYRFAVCSREPIADKWHVMHLLSLACILSRGLLFNLVEE